MKIVRFIVGHSPFTALLAVLAGAVSGLCNVALLAFFNNLLKGGAHSKAVIAWSLAGLCITLPLTRFISEALLTHFSQGALFKMRVQLSGQILAAPLRHLEELGAHRLMAVLTDDIPVITNTLIFIPNLCVNVAVVIGGLIYLGWLSWPPLLVVFGFMAVGILTYRMPVAWALNCLRRAREYGDTLFNHFRALTEGTKELKLHRPRREAFLREVLRPTAASLRRHNVKGMLIFTAAASWGQVLVFAAVGFILIALQDSSPQILTGYTITLLYLMSPLQFIMNTATTIGRANIALRKVEELRMSLAAGVREADPSPSLSSGFGIYERLELVDVTHAYWREGEKSYFILGPISLTLRAGELVFLIGGNGSGKTTLAKLLTGLYVPEAGEIRLNGQTITDQNRESYRQHFSAVFFDFYLFENLIGLANPRLDEQARAYLSKLQLGQKVEVSDGTLSNTQLSQGQRKRLALLTAYLEDRPVYVFDEWAADQDPVFKNIFYHQLLPELKSRGKTVLVISHDDRYYGIADRVIKLDYGKMYHCESRDFTDALNVQA